MERIQLFPIVCCYFLFILSLVLDVRVTLAQSLGLQDQFVLRSSHLGIVSDRAQVVAEGDFQTALRSSVTNTYLINDVYTVDLEQRVTELLLTYGANQDTQLDLVLPLAWRGGGVFDHGIREWHQWWGLPSADRDDVKNNQYLVEGETDKGTFNIPQTGFGFSNVNLRVKQRLSSFSEGLSDLVVSTALTLSLPTASPGFGHDAVDASFEILGGIRSGSWEFNSGLGFVMLWDRFEQGLEYRPLVPQSFLSAVYKPVEYLALTAALLGGVQPLNNVYGVPDGYVVLDLGASLQLGERNSCGLNVTENPYPSRASADVTVSLSCSRQW